ncbi:MAG TPA: hypothetical protein VNF04_06725 [Stellaceae bacterium]|nr:hypothetical protein [Stellaceae bacterium]
MARRQAMSLRRNLGCWARALCVALALMLAASAAGAIEPPSGSTNFTPPGSVPDYFSNESGPFRGGAAARTARPVPAPGVVAAPAPRRRVAVAVRHHVRYAARYRRYRARHIGRARRRLRLARFHAVERRGHLIGHRHIVHSAAARTGKRLAHRFTHRVAYRVAHRFAHVRHGHAGAKAVAVRARHRPAPSKARHVARLHG